MLVGERKNMRYYGGGNPPNLIKHPFTTDLEVSGSGAGPRVAPNAYRPPRYSSKDKPYTKGTHGL